MSLSLGLGGADEWRAFAGNSLISVPAADQTERLSTGSYDCQAASDAKRGRRFYQKAYSYQCDMKNVFKTPGWNIIVFSRLNSRIP